MSCCSLRSCNRKAGRDQGSLPSAGLTAGSGCSTLDLEGSFFSTGAKFFHLLSIFYSPHILIYFYVLNKQEKKPSCSINKEWGWN